MDGKWSIALVACVAACWLIAAAPARAAGDPDFGVNAQSLVEWPAFWAPTVQFPTPVPQADPYLGTLAADGVGVARTDAPWFWVQPSASTSLSDPASWAQLDAVVGELAQDGLRWQPVLDLAPAWAAQTPYTPNGCTPVESRYLPPAGPTAFAAFAGALAARYGPGGTFWSTYGGTALPVTRYEIWNEPNVDAYWNNAPSAAQYVAIYNAARTQIRAADPTAQVLVGGIVWGGQVNCQPAVTDDAGYIQAMFAAGGPSWPVDGIAVHPYGPAALNIVANLRREQQALQAVHRAGVPLEQTELGWPVRPAGAPAGSAAAGFADDASRAGTVALTSDIAMGSDCGVQSYDVYTAVEREASRVTDDPPGVSPYDLTEHWMGILALATTLGVAPNTITSSAYAAAIARDLAGANAGHDVPVCAPAGTTGRQLALTLTVTPTTAGGCFNATVTYVGLPVSGAELRATTPIQPAGSTAFGPAFTDPDGMIGFCVPPNASPTVSAVVGGGSFAADLVPQVAVSNRVVAAGLAEAITTTTSTATGSSPTGGGTPPGTQTTTTSTGTTSTPIVSPPPPCVISGVTVASYRLTVLRRRGLRAMVTLATASRNGCRAALILRVGGRTLATAPTRLIHAGATAMTLRLTAGGRRDLRHRRAVAATLQLSVSGASIGTGTLNDRLRLSG